MSATQARAICRIGVFYDGSFFAYAQHYYYHERDLGWLRFQPFHAFIESFVEQKEHGYSSYKVVYAAWHQGLFTVTKATPEQLRRDRNLYHDLMHAGVEPRYLPMSEKSGEKGTDVALAVDAFAGRPRWEDRHRSAGHRGRRLRAPGKSLKQTWCTCPGCLFQIRKTRWQKELHQRQATFRCQLRS